MANPAFVTVKNEAVYYNGQGEFILFVPELFFDRGLAVMEGEFIELIGIINYAILSNPKDSLTKDVRTFMFPARFITKPGTIEKKKDFAITKNYTADYRILRYTNNNIDQIIVSTKVPQEIDDVEDFFRVFIDSGHIPNTISYMDLYKYFTESIKIAGHSYGLSMPLFGILISELCRDPNDINKPFRLSEALDKNPYSYKSMSVKDVPKVVSPFTSITSENFDKAVVGAVMNKNNSSTPLEKVLMG